MTPIKNGQDRVDGVSHHRAIYVVNEDRVKVFVLVPGSNIEIDGPSKSEVELSTTEDIPSGQFTYTTRMTIEENGIGTVLVPYPGPYNLDGQSVEVSEDAVSNENSVQISK